MKIALTAFAFINLIIATFTPMASRAGSPEMEVGITEHLDTYVPDSILLTDYTGKKVDLKQLINKPTVLCFVYFRCPGICSPLMNGLAEVMSASNMVLGKDYQAITISFDPREGTDLAASKRANYLKKLKNTPGDGWIFLTGDSANIARATEAFGFRYKLVNNEFMHEGALMMVSPDAKITRYLKGISFLPLEFKLALLEASKGQSSPTVSSVLKFCYTYDPASQHYSLNILRLTASFILVCAIALLGFLLWNQRKRKKMNNLNQTK